MKHSWIYCDFCCLPVVICGTCGSNTCNPGYGEIKMTDGSTMQCPDCQSAYRAWNEEIDIPDGWSEWLKEYGPLPPDQRPPIKDKIPK